MSGFKSRLARVRRIYAARCPRELVVVDPRRWQAMSHEDLDALREQVRKVAVNPNGIIVVFEQIDGRDPVVDLMAGDADTLDRLRRARTERIERSYGSGCRSG